MLTDEELAAVPEELLKDLLRYSEYGWRDRRIVSLLARCYPVVLTERTCASCAVWGRRNCSRPEPAGGDSVRGVSLL